MVPTDEILESLDLSRAEPGTGFLEALFLRFNARIPFESASKIVRDAEIADPADKPRTPDVFWRDHLERGAGGTCFARVAAFDALLTSLGFRTEKALGRVVADFDHAALIVHERSERWICDVGFPLPVMLAARAGDRETPLGTLQARETERGLSIDRGGIPEGPRRLEVFLPAVSEDEFAARWRRTFRADSRFLSAVGLHRDAESRTTAFSDGELRVDDRQSRLVVPLARPRAPRLAEIFGIDADLLAAAFARAGDPDSPNRPLLRAYLETDASAADALSAIAHQAGYRRLLAGAAEPSHPVGSETAWSWRLAPPGARPGGEADLDESVTLDPEGGGLRVVRARAAARAESVASLYRSEERDGRTWLIREALLEGNREDLLRNDSLRGRLAASLSADLLAWARLL